MGRCNLLPEADGYTDRLGCRRQEAMEGKGKGTSLAVGGMEEGGRVRPRENNVCGLLTRELTLPAGEGGGGV